MFVAVLRRSLPSIVVATVVIATGYALLLQHERLSADDLPVQIAEDMAERMKQGVPPQSLVGGVRINPSTSLAPFAIVMNDKGKVVANSFRLTSDETPRIPAGVLQAAKEKGEHRVTWQPAPYVRLATAVVYDKTKQGSGTYIVVGHSLRETEARVGLYGWLAFTGWVLAVAGALGAAFIGETFLRC